MQGVAKSRVFVGQDRGRQQRGVHGPGPADGHGAHRHAGRHLHDGEQRIEALERFGLDGDAEDRQRRLGRGHAGQMRGAAGAGNNDFQAALLRGARVFEQQVRRPMSGNDPGFIRNAQVFEGLGGVGKRFPVGPRTHDETNQRRHGLTLRTGANCRLFV